MQLVTSYSGGGYIHWNVDFMLKIVKEFKN